MVSGLKCSSFSKILIPFTSQIGTIEAKVRKQISDYVVALALKRVTLQLEGKLTSSLQQQIIDRNISKLSD